MGDPGDAFNIYRDSSQSNGTASRMTLKLEFQLEPEFAEVDLAVDLDSFFLRFRERGRVVASEPSDLDKNLDTRLHSCVRTIPPQYERLNGCVGICRNFLGWRRGDGMFNLSV